MPDATSGRAAPGPQASELAGRVAVLGVRHHGPGSARSVVAELDRLRPGVVLIEGPADADPLLALATAPGMAPPVALLAYAPEAPKLSSFWPYAIFSPEWQALTWAAGHGVPVRFCDLPAGAVLAQREADQPPRPAEEPPPEDGQPRSEDGQLPDEDGQQDPRPSPADWDTGTGGEEDGGLYSLDPIGEMAAAAGYDDPERWWDDLVESRAEPGEAASPGPYRTSEVFAALTEAMAELREVEQRVAQRHSTQTGITVRPGTSTLREQRREAHMRQVLRAALKQTDAPVAVVCGAWHAPALAGPLPPASKDAALLRGLPRRKAALAWVPWTHSRLATASGYGAGITSPGWYHHLFTAQDKTIERWMTRVAGVLRAHDLPVSSAHVIEAVRLAHALATLRGRPLAGLAEVSEATRAVLCEGDDVAAAFVTRDLVVGELLGSVPDEAPPVPLDADLRARARSLRLRIEPLARTLELDLRKETDRAKSAFLHQLAALGIGWGAITDDLVKGTGTWRETWSLCWRPELAVDIIDAAVWGTTVAGAATARIIDQASGAGHLADVTRAVERVLLAELTDALGPVLRALDARAAMDSDVADLMGAVPALVRAVRYGNVRGTDTASLAAVVDALTVRVCAGLPAAVGGLADEAATALRSALDAMHAALALYEMALPETAPPETAPPETAGRPATGVTPRARWLAVLGSVAGRRDVHGLLAGRVTRLLADAGVLPWPQAARRLGAALSVGVAAAAKAAWVEGFLSGGGLLLVHDRDLLGLLDAWLASLDEEDFMDALPLLRRTFGEFSAPERASIARAVRRTPAGRGPARPPAGTARGDTPGDEFDADRAAAALRTVALILGGAR
ncbi:MAG TPA: DUF5682 family protein [Trebonia sp.]|nr:DUF5682 family protein [Trebonia sp.]